MHRACEGADRSRRGRERPKQWPIRWPSWQSPFHEVSCLHSWVSQDSHISHIAKVPAQAIASMTTKGTGSSSRIPKALKIARAASANAIPTNAQTIQDGKYEPRILREGAPSQPPSNPSIGAARHNRDAGAKRWNAPSRSTELIAVFMRKQCHRFIRRQQPPLWGSGLGNGKESTERSSQASYIPQMRDSLSTELRDLRACAAAIRCRRWNVEEGTAMEGHLAEALAVSNLGATRSLEWMHRMITLLEAALGQLHNPLHPAQGTLLEAASLLRQQIDPPASRECLGEQLTRREVSILKRLESGLSNKEIADTIFVSEGTLKWHLHNVYSKLHVKNRSGAMARARTLGIV